MNDRPAISERCRELLADRALQGLSEAEGRELESILGVDDDQSFDLAAASVGLAAVVDDLQPMPQALRRRVEDAVSRHLSASRGLSIAGTDAVSPRAAAAPLGSPGNRVLRLTPWLVAAACLALAVLAWLPTRPGNPEDLLASGDARSMAWAENPAGVTGDVVWSDDRQQGFLRLRGLDVNDARSFQYQLWIFDGRRTDPYNAVDGGVFDIDRDSGEVVIPIDAKLRVFEPTLFAITTEPPGGVVKHDPGLDPERFKIILTAPVNE